ncbi:MAG: ribonuclease HII [Chlamydiales bacterium]|jgi:ribonuclease HII
MLLKLQVNREEKLRLNSLLVFEQEARQNGYSIIAGVDEAGRGPLAGPVVAASCVIPDGMLLDGVNDSKKLTARRREIIFKKIINCPDIHFGIGIVDSNIIDDINIFQATIKAMCCAVDKLTVQADFLLVDGLSLSAHSTPSLKIIKGDAKSQSIGAASIIAKVTRDRLMMDYHKQWPQYAFDSHKGYGTAKHMEALREHGPCSIHRATFEPVKSMNQNGLVPAGTFHS